MKKSVVVTFDLDFTDYVGGARLQDEMEACWDVFLSFCESIPTFKSTWFIRIDRQIGLLYGSPDYIFIKHADKIDWLKNNGHEVGWHFHSYVQREGKWSQNENEDLVCAEMREMLPFIQKHKLKFSRMGWTYHTNKTMETLASFGLEFDFTAFPRPNYQWDNPLKDWSTTGNKPYYPSKSDYRVSGEPQHDLLQIPITTIVLPSKTDTDKEVIRNLNPAYRPHYFNKGLTNSSGSFINTLTHPYELLKSDIGHEMLAFAIEAFEQNIQTMEQIGFNFVVASEYVKKQIV